jgi:GDP-L-fucose synthase
MDLENKVVLVTGANGFLGSHIVDILRTKRCAVYMPTHKEFDFRNRNEIQEMLEIARPDIIFHVAAHVGGIGANIVSPGEFFYDNAIMGIEMMEQARKFGVKKYVQVGTTCSYPKLTSVPFKEEDIENGYPEETNAGYGIAKRALITQAEVYNKQYGMNIVTVIPTNLYGPGDNFNPETSHVIPALIRKMVENPTGAIDVWGTGRATRDLLYAEDAAEGIVLAAEKYDSVQPVNLGSGDEISIQSIVQILISLTGFEGSIDWDQTKPDGQPRRCMDITRAKSFGWVPMTPLVQGLRETIQWYRQSIA